MTQDKTATTPDFEAGRRYGLKEALNAIRTEAPKYAKSKRAWDAVNDVARVVNLLRVAGRLCQIKQ